MVGVTVGFPPVLLLAAHPSPDVCATVLGRSRELTPLKKNYLSLISFLSIGEQFVS